MNSTEHHRRERRKGCHSIAAQRARMASRQGRNHLIVILIFMWAILSGPFRSPPVSQPDRGPSCPPPSSGHAEGGDWPVTDYERGMGGDLLLRPRSAAASGTGRYRSRPSLSRLMADLRRPAARKDAALVLLAQIADPVTRAWADERIAKGEINRLSVWVQPASTAEIVLAAWRGEADAALADAEAAVAPPSPDRGSLLDVARLLETIAGVETVTSSGPKPPDRH